MLPNDTPSKYTTIVAKHRSLDLELDQESYSVFFGIRLKNEGALRKEESQIIYFLVKYFSPSYLLPVEGSIS